MPMVEGIGDEVVQVFGICLVILIFVTAWKSTAIRELPQIRAVFIVDRRSQVFNNDVTSRTENTNVPPDPGQSSGSNGNEARPSQNPENTTANSGSNSGCDKPTSPNNEINAFRLSYFSNLQNQGASTSAASTSQTNPSTNTETTSYPRDSTENEDAEHSIRVKLKYLNDDQRIVKGNLKELLGQFKRRYFQLELSNNKVVLLIFQGRVLREEETLETIGMYDNCVVHCLVKSGRAQEHENQAASASTNTTPADWNLGPLLLATLGAMFALAWFLAYWTYPQLFGITSMILLACLTTIFFFAVALFYYPQLFQSL